MSRYRLAGLATLVSFVVGIAVLVLDLVYHWPTIDYRVRLYILLASAPGSIGLGYVGLLVLIGIAAVWISLGRGWRQVVGAAVGSLLAVLVLYSGILSWAGWRRETDVTQLGIVGRTIGALVAIASAVWLARRGARPKKAACP